MKRMHLERSNFLSCFNILLVHCSPDFSINKPNYKLRTLKLCIGLWYAHTHTNTQTIWPHNFILYFCNPVWVCVCVHKCVHALTLSYSPSPCQASTWSLSLWRSTAWRYYFSLAAGSGRANTALPRVNTRLSGPALKPPVSVPPGIWQTKYHTCHSVTNYTFTQ